MDLTPPKCKRNGRSRHFVFVFIIENQHFPLKSSLGHPWDPRAPASSQMPLMRGTPPKWFLAITCAIWLRLIFRGRGSAWFFGAHLLFFHAWGRILEAGVGIWISRSTFWPGDLFGPKKWSRKNMFCGGMILWWGFRGIHPAQMNSMVPRSHMGRLLCPKTNFKNKF
mgnify:CR=1 FL=1